MVTFNTLRVHVDIAKCLEVMDSFDWIEDHVKDSVSAHCKLVNLILAMSHEDLLYNNDIKLND